MHDSNGVKFVSHQKLPQTVITYILGAGPAGLAAGYYMTRIGCAVTVLEAEREYGGFARTFCHGPFRYDTGAHRFHDKDAEITADIQDLMGNELIKVHAPSQIYWNGRYLDFPLSPVNVARRIGIGTFVRAGADFAFARLRRSKRDESNFAAKAYRKYGKTIADAFLIGYSEKLWGVPAQKLMPEVSGGRLKGLSARTMLYELLRGKQEKTEHLDGSFFYPRQGYGQIAERLAASIGKENIRLSTRVTKLRHDGTTIQLIECEGHESARPKRVVSSLPQSVLLRLLDPAPPRQLIEIAEGMKFRDLILTALFLNRTQVSRNASIYFPSEDVPFTRLYEPKNRSIELAPPSQTCVVVEIPCFADQPIWVENDTDLIGNVTRELERAGLIRGDDVIGGKVHRLRRAYPVLEIGIHEKLDELRRYLQRFVNLYVVGRTGRFEYTHVHDLLRQGKELAKLMQTEAATDLTLQRVHSG